MTTADLIPLLPMLIVAGAAVILVLSIAFYRNYQLSVWITLLGLALAFASLLVAYTGQARQVTPLIIMDGPSAFYMGLLFATSFVATLLSFDYFEKYEGNREEFYALLLMATLGSAVLVASNHFASFFMGVETLSVSLYAMIAYPRLQRERIEAGLKYLILAGSTSAFLLFGMALVYTVLGTLDFTSLSLTGPVGGGLQSVLLMGWGMLLVGISFKLALVPFHLWTPDVYQGAPAPVTGFVATVSKGGVFALLLRYFDQVSFYEITALWSVFAIISIASMLYGNTVALLQNNVKRILAYSSIAHLGYLLVAFLAGSVLGRQAVAFYLVAYFATTLSAFGVVSILSTPAKESEELSDYEGLFWRRPGLAIIFLIALISLGGIPPSAGLIGKIYIAAAGVGSSLWLLLLVLVAASVVGVFYYMRIVITMFRREGLGEEEARPAMELASEQTPLTSPSFTGLTAAVLVVLSVVVVGLGVYPVPVFDMIARLIIGSSAP